MIISTIQFVCDNCHKALSIVSINYEQDEIQVQAPDDWVFDEDEDNVENLLCPECDKAAKLDARGRLIK